MVKQIDGGFFARAKNNTKSLFLSDINVAEILDSIENQKFKGKLKGELSKYIQNWEYYPNCNAVNFLCKSMPQGNIDFFTNRIQRLVQKYKLGCCSCNTNKNRDYFFLNRSKNEIRFTIKDDVINSFIVYDWLEKSNSKEYS